METVTPLKEQFQGYYFPPRKAVTCIYTAVQTTAKVGIKKHRKATTQCIVVRYTLSQDFKVLKKILNITSGQKENKQTTQKQQQQNKKIKAHKKNLASHNPHISTAIQHFIIKKSFPGTYCSKSIQVGEGFCRINRSHVRRMCSARS